MSDSHSLLLDVFVYLLAGLLVVPSAKRLGLGPVFGYLLAGILIGPWGLALIREVAAIELFSKVSTVLLLFLVGLQATPERIKRLWRNALHLGVMQLIVTTLAVMLVAIGIGHPWHHALIAGLALALSSEAVASHAFKERYPSGSPLTETGYQLLLAQSLLLLPIIVFLPALANQYTVIDHVWLTVLKGAIVVIVVALLAHWLLQRAFRYIVGIGLDEVFAAFAVLLVIGMLLLVEALGLPLELGAFLSGLLLIRSEYGAAIRTVTYPFTGLLVGMFFISAGMQIDFATFIRKPLETFALVALLVFVKAWIIRNILRYSDAPRQQRIWLTTVLAQSGELAFVVIALAVSDQAIPDKLAAQLFLVIALSMLTTPMLLFLAARRDTLPARAQTDTGLDIGESAKAQVIVAGFGRVGRVVARLLKNNGYRVVVIDHNPDRFAQLRNEGFIGFYGNALRPDLLDAAGGRKAAAILIAIDDAEAVRKLVRYAHREYPQVKVFARAQDSEQAHQLVRTGAERAYGETLETALLMGEDVLESVGMNPLDAQAAAEQFRDDVIQVKPTHIDRSSRDGH